MLEMFLASSHFRVKFRRAECAIPRLSEMFPEAYRSARVSAFLTRMFISTRWQYSIELNFDLDRALRARNSISPAGHVP
jgi:hypothetical protein